jgi:hypothetical protein
MTRYWFLLLACALSGCQIQQYSTDPNAVVRAQMPADYAAFMENPGPTSLMPGPGNPAIPGQGTILPPNPVPVDPPRKSFGQKLRGLFVSDKPTGMTLPSPQYLAHPPQYFPPDLPFPLARELTAPAVAPRQQPTPSVAALVGAAIGSPAVAETPTPPLPVKVPGKVAPPTPEQVQSVPADVLQSLQKHFDPSVMPAGGRQPAPPVTMVAPTPTNVAPANPLVGTTWVRESEGDVSVTVTFFKERVTLTAPFAGVSKVRIAGDCAYGSNGLVFGVVTAAEFPNEQDPATVAKVVSAAGAPFCFRARIVGSELTLSDLRCEALGADFAKESPKAARRFLGVYQRLAAEQIPEVPPASVLPPSDNGRLPRTPVAPIPPPVSAKPSGKPDYFSAEDAVKLRNRPKPATVMPFRVPPTDPNSLPPPAAKQRSSLDAILEATQAFAAENPAVVRAVATEAGRAIGRWLGRELDEPRVGEVVGVMVGSALADKLIGKAKAKALPREADGRPLPAEMNTAEPSAVGRWRSGSGRGERVS